MKIDKKQTFDRRAEALLDRRVRALAREGKSISAAYRKPIPVKMRPLR
jgi:hypothetical protein